MARAVTWTSTVRSSSAILPTASDFALPVIDVARCRRGRMPPFAVEGDDLAGVRVLADLGVGHRADGQEAQLGVRIIHDLVRGVGPADRAADDIARADLAGFGAVAQRARARDDEEHLFLGTMTVERAAALARRQHVVGIAEMARAEQRADARRAPLELVAPGAVLELELVEVDDVLHRSISPNTMS